MDKEIALANLNASRRATEQAKEQEVTAVYAALDAGVSWAEIGTMLKLTKQTVHARYGARYRVYKEATRSTEPSKKADAPAPAPAAEPAKRAAEIHGQRTVDVFQQFAADRKAAKEDQERADFWEAKRKYVVTVDGAIYSPRGENGWDLHKVMRNVDGRNFQQSYSDMSELIAANEGLLYISRDKYDGLVKNAAADRELWLIAATERENTVTARPELAAEIKAMDEKLTAIQKQLKANRTKKGPAYKTGG